MKADNLAQIRSDRVWLTKQQCDIEEFRALVERTTNVEDYPFAAGVEKNVLIYDGDAVRSAAADPETRRALLAEWVEAMTNGPGVVAFKKAYSRHGADRHGDCALQRDDRRAARDRNRRRRSLRQARCQRPHLECAREILPARAAGVRRLLRQRHRRADLGGLARAGLPDDLAGQLREPRRRGAIGAPRLSSRLPDGRGHRALSGARAPHLAGADAAGRDRPLRHAARERADALSALFAGLPARLSRDWPAASSRRISTSTMCSSRSRRAMRRSSIRPSSTAPATTARATSAAWPTCCRSRRLMGAPWRASTARR